MNEFIILFLILSNVSIACEQDEVDPKNMFPEILIQTSMGDVIIELDRNRAPITVNNFLKYVKSKGYNSTIIHRVEKDFVIQGGGYNKSMKEITQCEKIYNESGNGLKNTIGTIAMARYDDPHSATSQFYFNLTDTPSLDPNAKNWGYTVFGEVVEGIDVLQEISKVKVGYSKKLNSVNVPLEPVIIKQMSIQ